MAGEKYLWGLLTVVVGVSSAHAESARDTIQNALNEALARTNKTCGTKIALAPLDWGAWEKAGAKAKDCTPILDALDTACKQDSGDPHPAAQAFVKDTVKSVRCTLLPDKNKAEEKVSIENGTVVYAKVPLYSPSGEVLRLLFSDPAFSPLRYKKREWEIENVDAPKAAAPLKKSCGDDMKLTIDLASWRLAGDSEKNIPTALDIGDMCRIYAAGLVELCDGDKAAVRKHFDGMQCKYGKAIKGKATVALQGRDVIVTSSTTIGFGDGELVRVAVEKKLPKKKKGK